jgi:hypothetical protein
MDSGGKAEEKGQGDPFDRGNPGLPYRKIIPVASRGKGEGDLFGLYKRAT